MKPIPEKARRMLDAIQSRLNHDSLSAEDRCELTEAWFSIANGFVFEDAFSDEPEKAAGEVTLIRHGESEANAGLPSDTPAGIPLTPLGHQQAHELAAKLPEPELIIVSSYLRTQQTAQPLIARFPQVPVETWEVHEFTYLNPEQYAGTTEAERCIHAREYWSRCDHDWRDGGGAESFADLIQRIDLTLAQLRQHEGKRVIVFTHGYFIKALRLRLECPTAAPDATMMGTFRDHRKNELLPNTGTVKLGTSQTSIGQQI